MRTTSRWPCSTRRPTSRRTASALRLREAPRTSGMTQKPHENEQPSWILTNARTRSRRASAWTQPIDADVACDERRRLLGAPGDDGDVGRKARGVEVRGAAGEVDACVGARRARGCLAALRRGLVRDAAAVHHGDVRRAGGLRVAVGEQPLADLVGVHVRDLAAQEFDAEPHRYGDRTALRAWRQRRPRHAVTTTVAPAASEERGSDSGPRREDAGDRRADGRARRLAGRHPGERLGAAARDDDVERFEERDRRRPEREPGEETTRRRARAALPATRCRSKEHPEGEHREEVAVERRRLPVPGAVPESAADATGGEKREERARERRLAPLRGCGGHGDDHDALPAAEHDGHGEQADERARLAEARHGRGLRVVVEPLARGQGQERTGDGEARRRGSHPATTRRGRAPRRERGRRSVRRRTGARSPRSRGGRGPGRRSGPRPAAPRRRSAAR